MSATFATLTVTMSYLVFLKIFGGAAAQQAGSTKITQTRMNQVKKKFA